jgi:thiamine biosynthesis lipoprotein
MGTEFQIVLAGDDERRLEQAANYALDGVERIDRQMSLYIPESELCWVNAHAAERPVPVEPGLFRLLRRAAEIWEATEGAFDVTVGPLVECWGFFRGQGAVPPEAEIDRALERVGMNHVELDPKAKSVHFTRSGIKIDLGGIAKGFAVDLASVLLSESGIRRALIHGGLSTVFALGRPPGETAWPVGIRHPTAEDRRLRSVELKDQALSTSGSYEKFFEHEGIVYSHILNPRSGRPVRGMLSSSAIAKAAFESDALSTAFFVMGVEKTRAYCQSRPSIGAVLVPEPIGQAEPEAVTIGSVH